MGWDLELYKNRNQPLGTRDEIIAKLTPCLGPERSTGHWVTQRDGCELRVTVMDHGAPIRRVFVGVSGSGDPFPLMRALASALDCEVLDEMNLERVDLASGHAAGLELQRDCERLAEKLLSR